MGFDGEKLAGTLALAVVAALTSSVGLMAESGPARGSEMRGFVPSTEVSSTQKLRSNECTFHDFAYCYTQTVQVSGALRASATSKVAAFASGTTCQNWMSKFANENGGEVQLPMASPPKGVSFDAHLVGWTGPGTYQGQSSGQSSNGSSSGANGPSVTVVVSTADTNYGTAQPTSVTAVVKANRSFTISFREVANTNDPNQVVSGMATYTCQNA
jgi:hypothetical protein